MFERLEISRRDEDASIFRRVEEDGIASTPRLEKILQIRYLEAKQLDDAYVDAGHLLLGLQ